MPPRPDPPPLRTRQEIKSQQAPPPVTRQRSIASEQASSSSSKAVTPQQRSAPLPPTDDTVPCKGHPHIFDIDELVDRYKSRTTGRWSQCEKQHCLNRYDVPWTGKLADFAKPIAKEQEQIIRSHLRHIADDNEDDDEEE